MLSQIDELSDLQFSLKETIYCMDFFENNNGVDMYGFQTDYCRFQIENVLEHVRMRQQVLIQLLEDIKQVKNNIFDIEEEA